jgi:hypothetical protein
MTVPDAENRKSEESATAHLNEQFLAAMIVFIRMGQPLL